MTISRFPIILSTPFLIMVPAWSQAAGDELWETRSSMVSSAHGAMDLGVNRECRPANWRDKPEFKAPGDKGECKSQQAERRGDGYVWKFDCGGTKGEGSARMLGRDRLEGQVLMDTPQGRFTLKMQSHKVGACKRG
jgi:hypothetical protein